MRNEKKWCKEFLDYMEFIVNHENYSGLPIKKDENGKLSWIANAKSDIGKKRIEWAKRKANELGIDSNSPGYYAKVMFKIHPTKTKPCQICGKVMSLYYYYPNANLLKAIKKKFNLEFSYTDSIQDITKFLIDRFPINDVLTFFSMIFNDSETTTISELIDSYELKCRNGEGKLLGPGAMSNFPDRFDGFHTYNRCCRSKEDSGRSKENLKSYGKDRRAYEYWSDGNYRAANEFMNSSFFKGLSADHIGPISLGFIHDSLVLRKMSAGDNSSKRNRLLIEDITKLIDIEKKHKISVMSWYSQKIWDFLKVRISSENSSVDLIPFYNAFIINRDNFMNILYYLKHNSTNAEYFFIEYLLKPKTEDFKYNYKFNELGEIISKVPRKENAANKKEVGRFYRIALDSIDEYCLKENRNVKSFVVDIYKSKLDLIVELLSKNLFLEGQTELKKLVDEIQGDIIAKINNHEDF